MPHDRTVGGIEVMCVAAEHLDATRRAHHDQFVPVVTFPVIFNDAE